MSDLPWGYWVWPEGADLTRTQVRRNAQEAADLAVTQARAQWLKADRDESLKALEAGLAAQHKAVRAEKDRLAALTKALDQRERDLEAWEHRLATTTQYRKDREAGALRDVLAALEAYFDHDLAAREIVERGRELRQAWDRWKELGRVPSEAVGADPRTAD